MDFDASTPTYAHDANGNLTGDGISNRTEYENNLDPQQPTACSYWVSYTTNHVAYYDELGDCPLNAPEQFIESWAVTGTRPMPTSLVHDVKISGSVDDNIAVDGTQIDRARGPKSFSSRSIAGTIADLQSGQFTLELWDWPSADYAGANIAKLGEPFTVEWEWWTPMYLSGPQYVCAGETAQFTASGAAGGPFTWGVSDANVATIGTDGLLTAVSPGVVSVVATDTASSTAVTQDVTVVAVDFDFFEVFLFREETLELPVTIQPATCAFELLEANGGDNVHWETHGVAHEKKIAINNLILESSTDSWQDSQVLHVRGKVQGMSDTVSWTKPIKFKNT